MGGDVLDVLQDAYDGELPDVVVTFNQESLDQVKTGAHLGGLTTGVEVDKMLGEFTNVVVVACFLARPSREVALPPALERR